jgi:hypothetical protein
MLIKHGTGKVTGVLNKEAVKKAKEKLAALESPKPEPVKKPREKADGEPVL